MPAAGSDRRTRTILLQGWRCEPPCFEVSSAEYSRTASSGQATESTASVDAAEVERAKREIQGLVQEIAELSRTEVDQAEFYDALLEQSGGGARGTRRSGVDTGRHGWVAAHVSNQFARHRADRESDRPVAAWSAAAAGAPGDRGRAGDARIRARATRRRTIPKRRRIRPTFLLVLAPVYNDQGPQGVVEVFQRPGARMATQRGYLRFLLQICEFAGDYLKGRRLRHLADKQTLWEQLETFTRTAHEKLDVRETAYTIANEGRRLIGCDRVSVAIRARRQMPDRGRERAGHFRQAVERDGAAGQAGDGRREDGRGLLVLGRRLESRAASGRGARRLCRRVAHQVAGDLAAGGAGRRSGAGAG